MVSRNVMVDGAGDVRGGLHLGIVGAALDTANLGVSALGHGTIRALDAIEDVARVTVFDYGRSHTELHLSGSPTRMALRRCGMCNTRRLYRPDSMRRVLLEASCGIRISKLARILGGLDGILDLSGGDSFSDLYGQRRFNKVVSFKKVALRLGVPLALMPQTYGPFRDEANAGIAATVCRHARVAAARDANSFDRLRELLGDAFDPERHISGVDMAFAMTPEEPSVQVIRDLERARSAAAGSPLVGLNISGLVYGQADGGIADFGFRTNYRTLVHALIEGLVRDHGAHIALVPHVLGEVGNDTDCPSMRRCLEELPGDVASHVSMIMPDWNPAQAKGLISMFDWFCGTRMHATIASLSTGTPTATILYSDKAAGVFETCGMLDQAVDPRTLDRDEVLNRITDAFLDRDRIRQAMAGKPAAMEASAKSQTRAIIEALSGQRVRANAEMAMSNSGQHDAG